jgi:prepilin-type N-terminal cleavage/methylation domain-containing protein/prepilin-type processing-associated H-X9-DG protein
LDKQKGFTLIELLVVISIIALLLSIMLPALASVKERSQRIVCLSNLKNLTMAWYLYATDNGDMLMFASCDASMQGTSSVMEEEQYTDGSSTDNYSWVGQWRGGGDVPWYPEMTREQRIEWMLKRGMLWNYLRGDASVDNYSCPIAKRDEVLTYQLHSSMNGCRYYPKAFQEGACNRKLTKIKRPSDRSTFIDTGKFAFWNEFVSHYQSAMWFDLPPIRHNNGVTQSFADGHSEYWKWKDQDTIELGRWDWLSDGTVGAPVFQPGNPDLERMQKAAWGRLGY